MEIHVIQEQVRRGEYEISFHAEKERYAEDISLADIEATILNGEILEDYSDDPRGESCLILGHAGERPIHVVCGYTSARSIRVITVYLPKQPKWQDERTRRAKGAPDA
ncbi:MAG: DUF4258 domain-containing protein [Candidatus Binatia bacterium]